MVCTACVMPVNSSYSVTGCVTGSLTMTVGGFIACFCCPGDVPDSLPQPIRMKGNSATERSRRVRRIRRPPFKTILTGQYLYHLNCGFCQVGRNDRLLVRAFVWCFALLLAVSRSEK